MYPDPLSTRAMQHRAKVILRGIGKGTPSAQKQLAAIALLSVLLSSIGNHGLAHWLGIFRTPPWASASAAYRRLGPLVGPQILCAGSSLLVWGLSWPEVSKSLGQGVESWTVAGSSPEVWEMFQQEKGVRTTTIIGVSVYDLNEMRLTPERASFVPLGATARDLSSYANSDLKRRILKQYAMSYIRVLYPTAGDADKVLVGLRTKAADVLGRKNGLQEHEGVVIERNGVLDVEDALVSVRDWSSARVLRRLEALRAENHGTHEFLDGPKSRALRRVLLRAQQQGRVIVAVLPVSQYYADAFLTKASMAAFEQELSEAMTVAPRATLVRLDQLENISDNRYFFDLVHLNSSGRRILTNVFLEQVNHAPYPKSDSQPWFAMHMDAVNHSH